MLVKTKDALFQYNYTRKFISHYFQNVGRNSSTILPTYIKYIRGLKEEEKNYSAIILNVFSFERRNLAVKTNFSHARLSTLLFCISVKSCVVLRSKRMKW